MLSHREYFYIRRSRRDELPNIAGYKLVVSSADVSVAYKERSRLHREMNLRVDKMDVIKKSGAAAKSVKGKGVIYHAQKKTDKTRFQCKQDSKEKIKIGKSSLILVINKYQVNDVDVSFTILKIKKKYQKLFLFCFNLKRSIFKLLFLKFYIFI